MKKNSEKLRIVLLLDNKNRELEFLLLLKIYLKKILKADVTILGSVAEYQYVHYQLAQINPHLVFISQVFEHSCRQLADYCKSSGTKVALLPSEIRTSSAYKRLVESDLYFDTLIDYVFMPGEELAELFLRTDIQPKKIKITGSPKIDLALTQSKMSRKKFSETYNLDVSKKNIFIFTSFVETDLEYMKKDVLFNKQLTFKKKFNQCIKKTRVAYAQMITRLAHEFPTYNIILKPHPLEKKLDFKEKNSIRIISDATIQDCYESIDIAIHWTSTVALECWLQHIPVLEYFPTPKEKEFLPYFTQGNPLYFSEEKLVAGVNKYLKKNIEAHYLKYQQVYLKRAFFKLDGGATERIAQFLRKELSVLPSPVYKLDYSLQLKGLLILENLLGHRLSRRILKLFSPQFKSEYAILNYIKLY